MDANPAAESSAAAQSSETVLEQSPAGEQPVPSAVTEKEDNTPFHKHPRWQEMQEKMNSLKQQNETLQSQIASSLNRQNEVDPLEEARKELASLGVEPKAAEKLTSVMAKLYDAKTNKRIAPLEERAQRFAVDKHIDEFAKSHSDYNELQPTMAKILESYPKDIQMSMSNDPLGVDFLYSKAKAQKSQDLIDGAYKKGVQDGYLKKGEKIAGSTFAGASPVAPSDYSEESIQKMSVEDYKKNLKAILASRGVKR